MIKSLCLTLVLAFAVMGQAIAKDPEPPVTIVTRVLGWSPFPRDAPLPRLQVAFEDNPALAKITETYLAAQGFSIAGPDGAHDYKVALSGNFAFDRPRTKRLSVPIGKLLADERMKPLLNSEWVDSVVFWLPAGTLPSWPMRHADALAMTSRSGSHA